VTEGHKEPRVFEEGDEFPKHYLVERFLDEGTAGQVYVVRGVVRLLTPACVVRFVEPKVLFWSSHGPR
jgi:hypothetical protein